MTARAGSSLSMLVPLAMLALGLGSYAPSARAQAQYAPRTVSPIENVTPKELEEVKVDEHLGAQLPLDAQFRDSTGAQVRLGDLFDTKRPVLLVFAYHTCPMLCSLVLDAMTRSLKTVPWSVGREFDVVSISIDPRDTPETAALKRPKIIRSYGREGSDRGFHFLVGDAVNIRRVTDAVGFQFRYEERQKQYAHPAAIFLLTPEGKLARYLYGIEFRQADLRLGLIEASERRYVSTTDKLLLYCYHYDPQGKRYAIAAMNVMRLGGAATAIALGALLASLWLRERKNAIAARAAPLSGAEPPRDAQNPTATPDAP